MKKLLSLLLSVCLVVTLIPAISFAADDDQIPEDENVISTETQEEIVGEEIPETPGEDEELTSVGEEEPDILLDEELDESVQMLDAGGSGWVKEDNGWRYYFSETEYYCNIVYEVTPNAIYCFDANGFMKTGIQTDPQSGYKYYFDSTSTPKEPGNSKYGTRKTGKFYVDGVGTCYFNPMMKKGWQTIDGKKYYFDSSTGSMKKGWVTLSGKKYYLDPSSGVMQTGKKKVDGKWYYFDPSTGAMQTGWKKINSKWYYYGTSGAMYTGLNTIGNYKYYFSKSNDYWGQLQTDCWLKVYTDTDKKAYFDANGRRQSGWTTIHGYKYYLSSYGIARTGWQSIDGSKYYFYSSGKMYKGWLTYKKNKYYLDKTSGKMKKGWAKIDSKWYFFDTTSGKMKKGWLNYKKKKYYFNTKTGVMVKGLQKISGTYYFFIEDSGAMKKNGCVKIDSKLYYFKSSGKAQMSKGWFNGSDKKKRYSLGNGLVATGTKKIGSTWYVLSTSNGTIQKTIGDDIDKKVQSKSSSTNYLIAIYRAKYQVRIYKGSKNNWVKNRKYDCAIGKSSTPTPTGTFKITKLGKTNQYVVDGVTTRYWYYCYIFNEKQGIHSGLYFDGTGEPGQAYDTRVNVKSTNGGVRVSYDNAKWIYNNVPKNTTVVIY